MIIGDFERDLRESMFNQSKDAFAPCRDTLGNFYYDKYEAERLFKY